MKIIKLKSENIKKLKAVEIEPKSNLVRITGKNAQGKTSIIDSIAMAIGGKKMIPGKPIREGEDKAKIELDLGDYKIERTFTDKGSYLKVTTTDGAEYPKAQEKLTQMVNSISFDPLEFAGKSAKEQTEILTNLLGVGEKLEKMDLEYKDLYEQRTFANRELKSAMAKVDKPKPVVEEVERVDVGKVASELEVEREKYANITNLKTSIEEGVAELKKLKVEIQEIESLIQKSKEELAQQEKDFDVETGKKLKSKLENANEINGKIEELERFNELEKDAIEKKLEAEKFDMLIKENREKRTGLIQNSKMPIDGLGINEDGIVVYKGIPFEQLSAAESLKVSLSIAIAMNPDLKVINIYDGSLLDEDNIKVIEDIANKEDYQIWIEEVDSSGEVGFYIEDGEVKSEN